jgi:hypothetical protein
MNGPAPPGREVTDRLWTTEWRDGPAAKADESGGASVGGTRVSGEMGRVRYGCG